MSHHLCKSTFSDEMGVTLNEKFYQKFHTIDIELEILIPLLDALQAASLIGCSKFLLSLFTKISIIQGRYTVLI